MIIMTRKEKGQKKMRKGEDQERYAVQIKLKVWFDL